jgi:hypothetical protein
MFGGTYRRRRNRYVVRSLRTTPYLTLRTVAIRRMRNAQRNLYVIVAFVSDIYLMACLHRLRNRLRAVVSVRVYVVGVGGGAGGPPGEAQGRVEGVVWVVLRGGRTVDTTRFALTRFDENRLYSLSLDSGIEMVSTEIYYNLSKATGAHRTIKHRYN